MESAIKIHVVLSFIYISLYFSSLCVYDIECKSQQFLIYKRIFLMQINIEVVIRSFFVFEFNFFWGGGGMGGVNGQTI